MSDRASLKRLSAQSEAILDIAEDRTAFNQLVEEVSDILVAANKRPKYDATLRVFFMTE